MAVETKIFLVTDHLRELSRNESMGLHNIQTYDAHQASGLDADMTYDEKCDLLSCRERSASLCGDKDDSKARTNTQKYTGVLILTALGISTGSFQYGYNLAVLNEPHQIIKDFMNSTHYSRNGEFMPVQIVTLYWSVMVSVFALGGAVGAGLAGWWALVFGRKRGCLANTVLGFCATAMMAMSPALGSSHSLIVGRFIMGIHSGIYTMLCPLYLNEISTPATRGPLGVAHQLGTVLGILVAEIFGFPVLMGSARWWTALLGFSAVPLLVQIILLSMCPDSPTYLAKIVKDESSTQKALTRLRGTSDIYHELYMLLDDTDTKTNNEKSIIQLIKMKEHRQILVVGCIVLMSPHIAGSIAVTFYSSMIFEASGASPETAMYDSSGIGAIMVMMSLVSVWLINKVGRRPLLLAGLVVMATGSVAIVLLQFAKMTVGSVIAVLFLILGFGIGPGPIPFTIAPELFPADVKRSALSVCVTCNWLANFGVGLTFPHIMEALDYLTFLVFAAGSTFLFITFYIYLPETKPTCDQPSKNLNDDSHSDDNTLSCNMEHLF